MFFGLNFVSNIKLVTSFNSFTFFLFIDDILWETFITVGPLDRGTQVCVTFKFGKVLGKSSVLFLQDNRSERMKTLSMRLLIGVLLCGIASCIHEGYYHLLDLKTTATPNKIQRRFKLIATECNHGLNNNRIYYDARQDDLYLSGWYYRRKYCTSASSFDKLLSNDLIFFILDCPIFLVLVVVTILCLILLFVFVEDDPSDDPSDDANQNNYQYDEEKCKQVEFQYKIHNPQIDLIDPIHSYLRSLSAQCGDSCGENTCEHNNQRNAASGQTDQERLEAAVRMLLEMSTCLVLEVKSEVNAHPDERQHGTAQDTVC